MALWCLFANNTHLYPAALLGCARPGAPGERRRRGGRVRGRLAGDGHARRRGPHASRAHDTGLPHQPWHIGGAAPLARGARRRTRAIARAAPALMTPRPLLAVRRVDREDLPGNCLARAPVSRCFVPGFDGAIFSLGWKEALWDRFFTAAPQRQRRCVEGTTWSREPESTGPAPRHRPQDSGLGGARAPRRPKSARAPSARTRRYCHPSMRPPS